MIGAKKPGIYTIGFMGIHQTGLTGDIEVVVCGEVGVLAGANTVCETVY